MASWSNWVHSHLNSKILSSEPVGGGFIASAFKVELEDGGLIFVKEVQGDSANLESEAKGLDLLSSFIRVPEVLGRGDDWLALEWMDKNSVPPSGYEDFGRALARLHKDSLEDAPSSVGLDFDNTIGATFQENKNPSELTWAEFFWEKRLKCQIEWAQEKGFSFTNIKECREQCLRKLSLIKESCHSLLHGDLWGGNHSFTSEGEPFVFDPAVYYGHREADLAMMRLFGSIPRDCYESYEGVWPLEEGWQERLPIYQLYHVLNHVNLFGGSYSSQAQALLKKIL